MRWGLASNKQEKKGKNENFCTTRFLTSPRISMTADSSSADDGACLVMVDTFLYFSNEIGLPNATLLLHAQDDSSSNLVEILLLFHSMQLVDVDSSNWRS